MYRQQQSDPEERRTMLWALALSVVIHLLLVLLSVWVPFGSASSQLAAAEPETTLTFEFADAEEPTTDDPLEDAPFTPAESSRAPTPVQIPEGRPGPPPVEPIAELRVEEASESIDRPPDERAAVEDSSLEPEPEPTGIELPADPEADLRSAPLASPRDRSFDMSEALRDFGRMRAERRPSGPQRKAAPPEGSNVFVPDLSEIPPTGFGMGNLVFESRDYDWSDYARQVYMAIWRAWHSRLYGTLDHFDKWASRSGNWRLEHSTQIHFVIERNGQVTGITLDGASTCEPFDASALEALEEVILPPLPEDFPRDQETVHARFIGQGPIRNMGPTLRYMKQAGYF